MIQIFVAIRCTTHKDIAIGTYFAIAQITIYPYIFVSMIYDNSIDIDDALTLSECHKTQTKWQTN